MNSTQLSLRAVIYARVSSQEQAKKEFSIPEMQIPQCKDLLRENDWRFVRCYIDEGFDGNTFLKRPGLQKMLCEDIDGYDVIITYSFDRLARDDQNTEAKIYNILDLHRKQATSVKQKTEIVDPDAYDPKSLSIATHRKIRSIGISYDSLMRRERFMDSKEKLVAKGKPISEAPFGYEMLRKIDPTDHRRTIGYRRQNNKEVPTLKRIFKERVNQGKSYRQIAFDLNRDGIKTRKGATWSGPRISKILQNPFPCGYIPWHQTQERKYGDETMRKVFPFKEWKLILVNKSLEKFYRPVIKEDIFWRTQKMRNQNVVLGGRNSESFNVLVGLIKCPICKSGMVETGFYKVKKAPYKKGFYQCTKWTNKHECSKMRYPSSSIKEKTLKKVEVFLDNPHAFRTYLKKEGGSEIKEREKSLRKYGREIEKVQGDIKSLNLKFLRDEIKEKYYSSLLQELENEEQHLENKYNVIEKDLQGFQKSKKESESLKVLSKNIRGRFHRLSLGQIKLIIRVLIKEIFPGKMQGTGIKGNPRVNIPHIIWNNPAIMEQECAFLRPRLGVLRRRNSA